VATPTIASRLRRRFILVSTDQALERELRATLPEAWEMAVTTDLDAIGGFDELLQHRFLLLDLDWPGADPLATIEHVRRELMLNLAIVCLGGEPGLRDRARLARADRFYARAEAAATMRAFCDQFGW
jgi:CheY-like chemotaxis protein